MARIVSRDQLIQRGIINPLSIYSRIVHTQFEIVAGGGAGYAYTPILGTVITLRQVIVFLDGQRETPEHRHTFGLKKGENKPANLGELVAWEDVIDQAETEERLLHRTYQARADFYFPITRLYSGSSVRFGIHGAASGGGSHTYSAYWQYTEG